MTKSKPSRILSLLLMVAMCASILIFPASAASTRAVNIPTRYAPDSWYGVPHQWTAKYYTYSSYIFEYDDEPGGTGNYLQIQASAQKPFTLEIYDADDDSLVFSADSRTDGQTYFASAWFIYTIEPAFGESFYLILRNNASSSITEDDNAYFVVTQHTK